MCNTLLNNTMVQSQLEVKKKNPRQVNTIAKVPDTQHNTKVYNELRYKVKLDLLTIIKAMGIISMRTLAQQNDSDEATMLAIVEDLIDAGEVDGHIDTYTLEFVSEIKDESREQVPPKLKSIKNEDITSYKNVALETGSTKKKTILETRAPVNLAREKVPSRDPVRGTTLVEIAARKSMPAKNIRINQTSAYDPALKTSREEETLSETAPLKSVTENSFAVEEPVSEIAAVGEAPTNFTQDDDVDNQLHPLEDIHPDPMHSNESAIKDASLQDSVDITEPTNEPAAELSEFGKPASRIAPVADVSDESVAGNEGLVRLNLSPLYKKNTAEEIDTEKEISISRNKNQELLDKDSLKNLKESVKLNEESAIIIKEIQESLQEQVGSLLASENESKLIGADILSEMTELRQLMSQYDQLEENVNQMKKAIAQLDDKILDFNIKDSLEKIETYHRELESLHASLEGHIKQTDDANEKINTTIDHILKNQAEITEQLNALARTQIKWSRSVRASQRGHH